MSDDFEVFGENNAAPFILRAHRGEGMLLLAMDWRGGEPPDDFVGFAIQYQEPGNAKWYNVHNRLTFEGADDSEEAKSSLASPIQKFRWVHFPFNAELPGEFTYRVVPRFMNEDGELRSGEAQQVHIRLRRETYPDELNVTFTRGFVSSQAFVDRFEGDGPISTLLPGTRKVGLLFEPTHPDAATALPWMGFEARSAILEVLDQAVGNEKVAVQVVAYDLDDPEIVERLEKLRHRLRIIIDNSGKHAKTGSSEARAAKLLRHSAGVHNVKRQHMGNLQHNKTIVVTGGNVDKVVCGSTNFSWRGLYVQNNNALVLTGSSPVRAFTQAFDQYWTSASKNVFGASPPADWVDLGLPNVEAKVAFSPHGKENALLAKIADDITTTTSSLFYSLAFLYQTDEQGPLMQALNKVTNSADIFVFGMSDKDVKGIVLQSPDGNSAPVSPAALGADAPAPFKPEPPGGSGIRLHHKFVVIDFDKPEARVYVGSHNFSDPADTDNGENLLLISDRRVAVSFMIEAVRIFDHYRFRIKQEEAESAGTPLTLAKPPRAAGEEPWWRKDYTERPRIRDRELFAGTGP